jgi:tyrosine-protein kinase Etk/Wzc
MVENTVNNKEIEFSGFLMYALILKSKWYIILVTILAAAASIVYSINLPNWYAATINVVPPKTSGSAFEGSLSSVTSTLKELGLSKLGGKSGGSDQYSFMVILNSRYVIDSLIKKYDIAKSYEMLKARTSDVRSAFLENVTISLEAEGNYFISVTDKDPQKAANMANDYIYFANRLTEVIYKEETDFNVQYLEKRITHIDSLLAELSNTISKLSNKYGIISPEDQATAYVKTIADLKSELMKQEILLEMTSNKYGQSDYSTKSQQSIVNSLKSKLNNAENKPGLAGNFSMNDAAAKGISFLSYYAQYEAMAKVKAFLLPTLEDSKLNQNRNLKNLIVVDSATPPDKKIKPKRSLIIAGITIGTFFSSILFVLLIYGFKVFSRKYKSVKDLI